MVGEHMGTMDDIAFYLSLVSIAASTYDFDGITEYSATASLLQSQIAQDAAKFGGPLAERTELVFTTCATASFRIAGAVIDLDLVALDAATTELFQCSGEIDLLTESMLS
jgi:hypothetical protein